MIARHRVALLAALAALALPGAAHAAVSTTEITTPADGAYVLMTDDSTPVTISGTAPGAADGDLVDIYCDPGVTRFSLVANDVAIAGQAFTKQVTRSLWPGTCRLHAIPDGMTAETADLSQFPGPLVTTDYRMRSRTPGGVASPDVLIDHYTSQIQSQGFVDYEGLFQCGLCDMSLFYEDTKKHSELLFYGNAFLPDDEGNPYNRSALRVDGRDAAGSDIGDIFLTGSGRGWDLEGVPPMTVTPSGGRGEDLTIDEEQDIVRCEGPGGGWPPTKEACGRLVSAGVHAKRRIAQTRGGTLVTLVDTFSSTDNQAHTLQANWFEVLYDIEDTHRNGVDLPWIGGGYQQRDDGQKAAAPPSTPASIFVKSDTTKADGERQFPQGVIVADMPIGEIEFRGDNAFVMPSTVSVPAGGSVTVRHTYAMATTRAALDQVAFEAEDGYVPPTVAITTPGEGAQLSTAAIDVAGTAGNNKALPAVTLNGRPATVAADGSWTAKATLVPGENTLTAVARDAAGNEVTATRKVVLVAPPPPADTVAPTLSGVSLSARTFRVAAGATAVAAAAKRGTSVRYTLSEPATASFAISRATKGRRVGGKCRRATRSNRRRRACTRYVKTGRTITRRSPAGASTLKFTGRIGTKKLTPGRYRMAIAATDVAGNTSKARRLQFRIVRR
ncbi:MAG TPA: hypothetical protein VF549_13550 [Solirubrobacteraceae bacterium]|jgi:hypothetical protein